MVQFRWPYKTFLDKLIANTFIVYNSKLFNTSALSYHYTLRPSALFVESEEPFLYQTAAPTSGSKNCTLLRKSNDLMQQQTVQIVFGFLA